MVVGQGLELELGLGRCSHSRSEQRGKRFDGGVFRETKGCLRDVKFGWAGVGKGRHVIIGFG